MKYPPGYHITLGTYGTRLHGCDVPFVDRLHNEYGTPFPPTDLRREEAARQRMSANAVLLSEEQREHVARALTDIAAKYDWPIHALAAQADHVHVVITAEQGDPLREALKAAASRRLNPLYGKRTWWAEGGSDKHLFEPDYFANAVEYVLRQKTI